MLLTPSSFEKSTPLVKADQAAFFLGISKQRLYELCRRNILPTVRFGPRQIRFDLRRLEEFIENGGAVKGGSE